MDTTTQPASFAEALSAQLAEYNIHIDAASVAQDVAAADVWLSGDGTHLTGTPLQTYVDSWGWETLKPLLEYAVGTAEAQMNGGGVTEQQSDADIQASWVYDLLVAAELLELELDPYSAPDAVNVAELVKGDCANPDTWPELTRALEAREEADRDRMKQQLKAALDRVGPPPPSQW